jgi:aerobic carbon-monoxide dehydrogenase medium subunit
VKPPPFGYSRPESVAQAVADLAEHGQDGKVLAGGQSLLPLLNMRLATPAHLVDINRIGELSYVSVGDGEVRIGALTRHAEVLADPAVTAAQPLIGQALRLVAHPVIRNRGTTVGSIVHADPSGEMTAVLALLGGRVRLASAGGERSVPAGEFFLGPLESDVREDELALEVAVPTLGRRAGTAFAEVSRRSGDYAVCGVAAIAEVSRDGAVTAARTAYLSVAGTPLVLDLTEAAASNGAGRGGGAERLAAAARLATERVSPGSDIHATADYRRHLAGVLTRRALCAAVAHAKERSDA